MQYLWPETAEIPEFAPIEGDIRTDVLIIGGGMAGVLCAYMLGRAGVGYVLAEAGRVCGGVTRGTTAKITSQHGLIYGRLLRSLGAERAKMYLDANEAALAAFRELCAGADCDFEDMDSYIYSISDKGRLASELAALDRLGFRAELAERLPLPFETAGAVRFSRQAQFNPLKFIAGIARGLNIYENSPVTELNGLIARTPEGSVKADRVIVATHFPFIDMHGAYFLKMYQHRSYVSALEGAQAVRGMYADGAEGGLSFRNYGKLLLLGGGGGRTGRRRGGWSGLEAFAGEHYAGARVKYRWATQDCMTLDGAPYIGSYGRNTRGLYVCTGFNKWGMTSSMVSARLLTDMLTGKRSEYAPVFSPTRTVLRPQTAVNAAEAASNLLTPSKRRCTHLGCALKWNPAERTWDCPCHGSRFTAAGKPINGPAARRL